MPEARAILLEVPEQLKGPRVVVRRYSDADAAPLHEAIQESVEHLRPWMPWYDKHQTLDDTLEYVRRTQARWITREDLGMGIFARDGGAVLGGTGLHVQGWDIPCFEIGYWVRRSQEGHGYITEAVRLLAACAFEQLRAQRLAIHCDARNIRSKAIPERLGFVYEGCLRHEGLDTAGQPFDMLVYAMIPNDYERARVAWANE